MRGLKIALTDQIDPQNEIITQIEIQGKKVTTTNTMSKKLGSAAEPYSDHKATEKTKRKARQEAREKVRSNRQKRSD